MDEQLTSIEEEVVGKDESIKEVIKGITEQIEEGAEIARKDVNYEYHKTNI